MDCIALLWKKKVVANFMMDAVVTVSESLLDIFAFECWVFLPWLLGWDPVRTMEPPESRYHSDILGSDSGRLDASALAAHLQNTIIIQGSLLGRTI